MTDYAISLALGVVEGLTEFLPVSSTAHLRIAETIFHLSLTSGYWKMYTIVIQLGAILCPEFDEIRVPRRGSVLRTKDLPALQPRKA